MYDVVGYHRPTTLSDALQLLVADQRVPLAGGVHLRHDASGRQVELVDLQAAGLDDIEGAVDGDIDGPTVSIGAAVRLQTVADDERLPELVRHAARSEQPSTLRTLATIGGTLATAADDSLLLAALLVHDADVRLASHERAERSVALAQLLERGPGQGELIVDVTLAASGTASWAQAGRTPRDRPIVGVAGRRHAGSDDDVTTLAVCGLGTMPQLVEPDAVASLPAIDDHRATATYRRHLAEILTARVMEDLA